MSHADTDGRPCTGNAHGKQLHLREPPPTGLHGRPASVLQRWPAANPFTGDATGEEKSQANRTWHPINESSILSDRLYSSDEPGKTQPFKLLCTSPPPAFVMESCLTEYENTTETDMLISFRRCWTVSLQTRAATAEKLLCVD